MPRRDWSSKKSHAHTVPRKSVRRDQLLSEKRKKRFKIGFFSFVFIAGLCALGYWLFFSPLFMIDHIEIGDARGQTHAGLQEAAGRVLEDTLWGFFPSRNYFLFSSDDFLSKITMQMDNFDPLIEQIEAKKMWRDRLVILYRKRIARLRLVTRQEIVIAPAPEPEETTVIKKRTYLIDDKGFVVSVDPKESQYSDEPIIEFKTDKEYKRGEYAIDEQTIADVIGIFNNLQSVGVLTVDYFEVDENSLLHEVIFHSKEHVAVYFSGTEALQKQINYLVLTLDRVKERRERLEYIDLRIPNRAYVCCYLE